MPVQPQHGGGVPQAAINFGQQYGLNASEVAVILANVGGDIAAFKNYVENKYGGSAAGGTAPATAGSGSSSGYGGGGSAGPDPAALRAGFLELLHSWDLKPDGRLGHVLQQAVNGAWSMAQFTMAVRRTKEYKQAFDGIQGGMSEAEYLSRYRAYVDIAKNSGYKLTREGFGDLMRKGIEGAEWLERIRAYGQIKANKGLLVEFTELLNERGLIKGPMKPKELKDFVTGKGSVQWTSLWNQAAVGAGLESIGFTVGVGGDLSRKDLLALIKSPISSLNPGETLQIDYAALADAAARSLPASRLYGMGITKKDLVRMALGGAGAKEVADRVQLAIGTATAAATEQRANPQLTPYGMVTQQRKRQATE